MQKASRAPNPGIKVLRGEHRAAKEKTAVLCSQPGKAGARWTSLINGRELQGLCLERETWNAYLTNCGVLSPL